MAKHFLLATAFFAASAVTATADPVTLKDTVPHIATTGHATAEVVPDQADISLGVSNERPTAAAAAEATAKSASDVIAKIKAEGIDPKDIKTSFAMSAQYDEDRDGNGRPKARRLRGYLCEERIIVRLHDVSKAGALARAFIEKGANEFQGIYFSYSKEISKRNELKAASIRDALAAAKIYTDAIGLKLGRALQIGDESFGGAQADLPSRAMAPMKSAVVIPTEPGVQTIQEDISVIWEIEGKAP